MKLIVSNVLFTLKGGSTVKDEEGNDVLKVKGSLFSFSRKKCICDMNDNLLFVVKNKLIRFITSSAYILNAENKKIATIKQRISFKKAFEIISDEYEFQGDFLGWNFYIFKNGQEIAKVERNFNLLVDKFTVEIADEKDVPLAIAFIIAIDNIIDESQDTIS